MVIQPKWMDNVTFYTHINKLPASLKKTNNIKVLRNETKIKTNLQNIVFYIDNKHNHCTSTGY